MQDLSQVSSAVEPQRKVMVVGGAQIYEAALQSCAKLLLTRILSNVEGDTTFPMIDWDNWKQESKELIPAGPKDEFETSFEVWSRIG